LIDQSVNVSKARTGGQVRAFDGWAAGGRSGYDEATAERSYKVPLLPP
jgi:hypothetical protein